MVQRYRKINGKEDKGKGCHRQNGKKWGWNQEIK